MTNTGDFVSDNILEPPGMIAILGGGPLAIEAALYARYLGFSVTLLSPGPLVEALRTTPLAPTPDLLASPLGLAALAAQRGLGSTMIELDCPNYEKWVEHYFLPLCEVDLLQDSVHSDVQLVRVFLAASDDSESDADDEFPVPPDFVVEWTDRLGDTSSAQFEAIIDMRAVSGVEANHVGAGNWFPASATWLGPGKSVPEAPPAYYFMLPDVAVTSLTESQLADGFERLRSLFANLCDRPKLDVYANLGGYGKQ